MSYFNEFREHITPLEKVYVKPKHLGVAASPTYQAAISILVSFDFLNKLPYVVHFLLLSINKKGRPRV